LISKLLPNDIDYVLDNWGSRNDTWIAMFKRFRQDYGVTGDVIFIDSDNVVAEDFLEHHHLLRSHGVYGILDHECWAGGAQPFLKRCFPKDRERAIFMYKVYEPRNYFRGGLRSSGAQSR